MERTEELDPVEDVATEEDEIEARAERIASLERDIRDASAEAEPTEADVERELSLTRPFLSGSRDVRNADVIDIERRGNKCWLTVGVDNDEFEYRLDYDADPTDASSSLVRLCKWQGVAPENIADLREVPVVRYGDEWRLFVPPKQRTTQTRVELSSERATTITHPTLSDYPGQLASRVICGMLQTPLLSTSTAYKEHHPFDGYPLALLAAALFLALPVIALSELVGILLTGLFLALSTLSLFGIFVGDVTVGERLQAPTSK